MVKTKNRQSSRVRLSNLTPQDAIPVSSIPERHVDVVPRQSVASGSEKVIFDDGKIRAAVIDAAPDETWELARIEQAIRKELSGRPIHFKLAQEDNGLVVSAIVPTYYSKQLLLRAVQQACAPAVVLDRICVPYPSCSRP